MTTTPPKFLPAQADKSTLYRIARSARTLFGQLTFSLLPPQCVCCGKTFLAQKQQKLRVDEARLQESLCVYCLQGLQKYSRAACKACGLGLGPRLQEFGWTHCRHCRPSAVEPTDPQYKTWVCADYEPPFDQWISKLKYGGGFEIAPFLAAWMSLRMRGPNGIASMGLTSPDVWMAVPSHASKVKQRGYNQAALIAKSLSEMTGKPYVKGVLVKTGETLSQAELGKDERMLNLANSFVCQKPIRQSWTIGLVDDVMTTGTTLDVCTQALLKAGAKDVIRFAVCRTPE